MNFTKPRSQLSGRRLSNDDGTHTELRNAAVSSYDEPSRLFKDFFSPLVDKQEGASKRSEFKEKTKKLVHSDQLWQEFRSEVDRHDVKTDMGVQIILQKFVADEMREVSVDARSGARNASANLCQRMLSFNNPSIPVERVRKGKAIEKSTPFLTFVQQAFSRVDILLESKEGQHPNFPEKTKQSRVPSSDSPALDSSRQRHSSAVGLVRSLTDEARKMKERSLLELPPAEIPFIPPNKVTSISRQESNADTCLDWPGKIALRKPSSCHRKNCDRGEAYSYNKSIESQSTTYFDTRDSASLRGSSLLAEWGDHIGMSDEEDEEESLKDNVYFDSVSTPSFGLDQETSTCSYDKQFDEDGKSTLLARLRALSKSEDAEEPSPVLPQNNQRGVSSISFPPLGLDGPTILDEPDVRHGASTSFQDSN